MNLNFQFFKQSMNLSCNFITLILADKTIVLCNEDQSESSALSFNFQSKAGLWQYTYSISYQMYKLGINRLKVCCRQDRKIFLFYHIIPKFASYQRAFNQGKGVITVIM